MWEKIKFIMSDKILKYIKDKKMVNILVVFLTGLILITMSFGVDDKKENKEEYININQKTEEQLKDLIESIDGIKKVKIMICFSDTGVKEYYKDETENSESDIVKTDSKMVFKRNGGNEEPILKRELNPEVKGVTIVADCTKKDSYDLIKRAVKSSLGISENKIEIIINER